MIHTLSTAAPHQSMRDLAFAAPLVRQVQRGPADDQREDAQREVDVERPPPRRMVGDEPADSGPPIIAAGITAIITPMYLPRSRGETSIPITDMIPTISPPAPSPWKPRNSTSSVMFCAIPHSAEPIRNSTTEIMNIFLCPNRSPSFPQIGVAIVEARM